MAELQSIIAVVFVTDDKYWTSRHRGNISLYKQFTLILKVESFLDDGSEDGGEDDEEDTPVKNGLMCTKKSKYQLIYSETSSK